MDYIEASLKIISIFSSMVVIATGIAAIYYVLELIFLRHRKRETLERYLQGQSENSLHVEGGGACSVIHLMAKLKLSESEVFDAAFASHHIVCPDVEAIDAGLTNQVMFQYVSRSTPPFPVAFSRAPFSSHLR